MRVIVGLFVLLIIACVSQVATAADRSNKRNEPISTQLLLEEFKDVIVIQRRFLPKTNRFELLAGGGYVINDPFFHDLGLSLRFGYYFTEFLGIELIGVLWGTMDRQVTTDLREKKQIATETAVVPLSYYGLDFKWSPFYGKIAYDDQTIVPFDFYFSAGFGSTPTSLGDSAPTAHLGTGQIFAMSKWLALRWDLSWNIFRTTSKEEKTTGTQNNLFVTVGTSFFFPEAEYR